MPKKSSSAAPNAPLEWHTEKRKLSDLVEWEKNPRQLTEDQAKHLGESLKKFGYVEPIAINLDGKIIGGHMRRRVLTIQALVAPGDEVDVRLPNRLLTTEEAEELAIRLNRNTAEWDYDKLANEFDEDVLVSWGFEEKDFGMGEELPAPVVVDDPGPGAETHTCPKCGHVF